MKPPIFRKYDAGALEPNRDKGDCQVRAFCTARGITYQAAWEILYAIQGEKRYCGFHLPEVCRSARDPRIGVIRELSFPAVKGKPRMTGEEFARKYPRGRYIVRMAHHVACVKDGQIYDTWDCSGSCVYQAWEIAELTSVAELKRNGHTDCDCSGCLPPSY